MTLEQIENAEREISKWFPPQTDAETPIWRRALELLVSSAKTAIPSGQVAEDGLALRRVLDTGVEWVSMQAKNEPIDILSRLAAQAQSADDWKRLYDVEKELHRRTMAERDRLNEAGTALMRESNERLERAERAETRVAELESAREELSAALAKERAERYEEVCELKERVSRLAAAGQVLSEHVDKVPECAGEPDCGWHNGGPCKACKNSTGWTLRDEFAMVAMHTVTVACKAELDDGRLSFRNIAIRSYGIADEMLKAREDK